MDGLYTCIITSLRIHLFIIGPNSRCSHWQASGLPSQGDCSVWGGGWNRDPLPASVSLYLCSVTCMPLVCTGRVGHQCMVLALLLFHIMQNCQLWNGVQDQWKGAPCIRIILLLCLLMLRNVLSNFNCE